MSSFFKKKQTGMPVVVQMLVVFAAFALMGASSFFFVKGIEQKHLISSAKDTLSAKEFEIATAIQEYELFMNSYSETVRNMILHGDSAGRVFEYVLDMNKYMLKCMDGLTGIYGYFDAFNGAYVSGQEWLPYKNSLLEDQPWYKAAMEPDVNNEVIITEPYKDAATNHINITFISPIFDGKGRRLGIIWFDVELDNIFKFVIDVNMTENSYGMLIDKDLKIMVHPEKFCSGLPLSALSRDIERIAYDLEQGLEIFNQKTIDDNKKAHIIFFREIMYGWRLCIITPFWEHYRSMSYMTIFLVVLGCILVATLNTILFKISEAKRKSDLRTQQKSNFLATMSHEIRTPLNAIMGVAEIQLQNSTISNEVKSGFVKVYSSGDLLLNIINDILDLSKIEAGKMELVPVRYEVASLVNDIVQLNIIRYEYKPVEFKLTIDENIPSALLGDELRIKQILNNLLSNAFKYTDRGEVTMSVNAECVARSGRVLVTLVFNISDTGQGMTPDQLSKLFDEYTRFNLEANRTTEGAGLGMSITRNLVELMYGKISIKSVVGEGTSVTVRIPQKTDGVGIGGIIGKELAESLQQFRLGSVIHEKKTQITREPMPYGRVLIVDDVETNLYVAKGLMVPYGLKIDLAASGFEAIEKIEKGNVYDVVFMDHMMPKMDGIETTKLLRNKEYKHPIVALTANALAGQEEIFLQNGFDGFISKPIDMRQLNQTLNKLIRDKQSAEVIEAAHREKAEMESRLAARNARQPVDPQLAEIFSRDAEKSLAVLEKIMQNGCREDDDLQMYIINIHAMKSALANIGETEVSAAALKLEQAGRYKIMRIIEDETSDFIDALRAIVSRIKPKEDSNSGEDAEDDMAYLQNELIILQVACSAYDKKAAKDTLNQLRERTCSSKTKELLNAISECLLHSEFDEVVNLTEEFLEKIV